ncbi:short-chain dehydrogenase/reductase family 16C member 6-like [Asterias rubens]|uniref:short-chain dehydrogenase/reductase family 16C member 6-like n=1 Tax=Asterias rubens TaxID=7604 RepID=UPI00145557BA|nr:short-chain dehydrogenase/reductase family 16C member 6-like [Asterias rubens]
MGIISAITALFLVFWYCTEAVVRACIPWGWRKRKDITGEIVLITGAGSGMGRLMAVEFAKRNAVVVLWDINEPGNRETMRMIKAFDGNVLAYKVDVTNAEEVYETANEVKQEVGDVTVLVNNAGVVTGKRLMNCSDDMIRKTMDVNVTSHFWTLKSFLPAMKAKNKGHIITIASLAGQFPATYMVDYCASKFGAVGLHSSLRMELQVEGYDGIGMLLVCPGPVSTGMFKGAKFT